MALGSSLGAGVLVLAVALGLAPFQCARDPGPELQTEDDPAEALYGLSLRFHAAGDEKARDETLRYLIERYPSSRFSVRAREELHLPEGAAASGAPPPTASSAVEP